VTGYARAVNDSKSAVKKGFGDSRERFTVHGSRFTVGFKGFTVRRSGSTFWFDVLVHGSSDPSNREQRTPNR